MYTDATAYAMAQVGLKQIEEAILRLLTINPQGLRNVEITNALGLQSNFQGGSRNYLAYSVLGILLEQGKIVRDVENRLFLKV